MRNMTATEAKYLWQQERLLKQVYLKILSKELKEKQEQISAIKARWPITTCRPPLFLTSKYYNIKYYNPKIRSKLGVRVKMCSEWASDPYSFYRWAAETRKKGCRFLRRKIRTEDYSPDNCEWFSR